MPSNVETSGLEYTDSTDSDVHNAALRHRGGDAEDTSGDKKSKVNETAVETPLTPSNEAGSDDPVEYVKGHPVIKNGALWYQVLSFWPIQS
jgi:hypothetical protein